MTADITSRKKVKIGAFCIGLDTYWKQFDGLRERLIGYYGTIVDHMKNMNVEVIDAGLVDNPLKARGAAELLKRSDVQIIFLYVSTYALSSTVLPVVQKANVPVVILNIQPTSSMEYTSFNQIGDRTKMTGEWLANCQACAVPEIASVFNRSRIGFYQITGYLDEEAVWKEIQGWIDAAKVKFILQNNRVGFLGHYYSGMLDIYSDLTQQSAYFGNHFELLEMDELNAIRDKVTKDDITGKRKEMDDNFDIDPACSEEELNRAAKTAVALDSLIDKHKLGSMAYYYEGQPGNEHEDIITSVITGNSLLTANLLQ